jgi:signal transduction histidine kinase
MFKLFTFIALLTNFSITVLAQEATLPITIKNNWSFQQSDSSESVSVKTGAHLSKQVSNIDTCCTGDYQTELNIEPLKSLEKSKQSNLAILFPPIGGLQSISINGEITSFPKADYTSVGPILPIPESAIQIGSLKIGIHIDSTVSPFAGMWMNAPVIDEITKLIIKRDDSFIFQKTLPLFFAVIFFMFGITFTWIQFKSHIKSPMYQEYVYGFFSWSIFFLFLSGTVRSVFPIMGAKLHYSIRGIAGITTFRIISTYAKVNKGFTNKISLLLLGIFLSTALGSIFTISDESQILAVFLINLFCIYPLFVLPKKNKEPADIIFFCMATISVIGNFIDAIHLYFNTIGLVFPIIFLNRITTPPFLFLALIYLGNHLMKEITKSQKSKAYEEISAQVSHDIRSPLSALEVISGSLHELPADKRTIIRNSINRIRDISNSLLTKNKIKDMVQLKGNVSVQDESFNTLLSPLIDSIITEKRIQYRNLIGIGIDFNQSIESYGLFAKIEPNEFKRVLSNLIDNAVESLHQQEGAVDVVLQNNSNEQIEILIKDNGKGIPKNILPKLGIRGETHGKLNGSGLGLFHAKETIQRFNGFLKIESQENQGTTITILLPKEKAASWFVSQIKIQTKQTIVVLDDDQSIHDIWNERIKSIQTSRDIKIIHFSKPAELKMFFGKNFTEMDDVLFLMDYEINNTDETGLDLIEILGIRKQSILITSRYEERKIRERCERIGVRLIPKTMSGFVPFTIKS